MTVDVEIWRRWDAAGQQSEEVTPLRGHSVAIVWRSKPPPVDAGVPEAVAAAIATVLVAVGSVAFRWPSGTTVPPDAHLVPAPARGLFERAMDHVAHTWPTDLVVTRSAAVARELFAHDWDLQGQAALVLEDDGERGPALSALGVTRDWRAFAMAPPVIALLAPLADGDGAVLATASPDRTEAILERLSAALAAAGATLSMPA